MLQLLGEEFLDFTISAAHLPSVVECKAANETMKPYTSLFWSEIELQLQMANHIWNYYID